MLLFILILIGIWVAVGIIAVRAVNRGRERRNNELRDEFTNNGKTVYMGHISSLKSPRSENKAVNMPPPKNNAMENGNTSSLIAMWLEQLNNMR